MPGTQLAKTVQFFGDNFVSVLVWIAAASRSGRCDAATVVARTALVLVGAMVALVERRSAISRTLWKSQLETTGPTLLARAEVAAGLGLGLGMVAGALVALRRSPPGPEHRDGQDPQWVERLIADLDDDALGVVCTRLVADEVIPIALAGVASRATPVMSAFGSEGLVFVVLAEDQVGTHVWSITSGTRGLRVQRGTPAPMRAEIRTTFPVLLQILGGGRTLAAATVGGGVQVSGDSALIDTVGPYLHPDTSAARPVATV